MIRVGDQIPIQVQLFDGATGKFPRAVVRDAAGATISGSPFSLTHVALGQYSNTAAVMPSTAYVTVQIAVYNDAGFTALSADHEITLDQFDLDESSLASTALDNTVWTNAKAAFVDVAISSRNAVAPANSDIAAIKVKTDQLLFDMDTGVIAHTINTPAINIQDIVDGVWDEPISAHLTAGTTGKKLNDGGTGGGGGSACGLIVTLSSSEVVAGLEESKLSLSLSASVLDASLNSDSLTVQFNCGP